MCIRDRYRRENVGMSSERQVRILPAENLRFPEEGSSAQGKSGPCLLYTSKRRKKILTRLKQRVNIKKFAGENASR